MSFEFGWQAWMLLGGGLLFVVLEVLFPSGGLLGIGAGICLILGGVLTFKSSGTSSMLSYVGLVALMAPLTMLGAFTILPHTPMGKAIILRRETASGQAVEKGLDALLGSVGTTLTPLRPAGIALINDRRVDVVTRGTLLDTGARVRVLRVEGNRVVVAADDGSAVPPAPPTPPPPA